MLSSGAMKRTYPPKSVTFLLLVLFMIASLGTVFGYAWCVGDDGHVEVSYANDSGCCADDLKSQPVNRYDVPTVSQASGGSCGLCLDFTVQQYDVVFFKRVKRTSVTSVATFPSHVLSPNVGQSVPLVASLALQPVPRVSKTILAHRTTVLLN